VHWLRGQFRTAYEVANDLMRRAQIASDPALLLYAHHALGQILFFMGKPRAGRTHLEKAVSLYDPAVHPGLTSRYTGIDAKVHCQGVLALFLAHLGYPQRAMTAAKQVLTWAQDLGHPYSLIFAEYMLSGLLRDQNNIRATQERAEQGILLCIQYGEANFEAFMSIYRGWAIAQQGHGVEGVDQIRAALQKLRARGIEANGTWDLRLLAEAYCAAGKLQDGLTVLGEAMSLVEQQEAREYEAEIRRLTGELLLLSDQTLSSEAAQCFRHAIGVARRQGAKWWELRATMSLARLLASQGRRDEARTILTEIYNWFTEGFDTADLKDAKALLDELSE
jgi:predicted ATPase